MKSPKQAYLEAIGRSDELCETLDCSVIATSIAARVPYDVARDTVARIAGRKHGKRCTFRAHDAEVFHALGYDLELVDLAELVNRKGSRLTVSTVADWLPTRATYLIYIERHVFALVNGRVLDWTEGCRHRIRRIYRVIKQ